MKQRNMAPASSQAPSFSQRDVVHVAELARLHLGAAELERYRLQLASILDYVGKLQRLDTTGVAVIAQVTGLTNRLREDTAQPVPPLARERLLSAAPERSGDFFQTTGVFA